MQKKLEKLPSEGQFGILTFSRGKNGFDQSFDGLPYWLNGNKSDGNK